jgi:hypothetical protein
MIELFPPPGTLALCSQSATSASRCMDSSILVRILCLQNRQISSTLKDYRKKIEEMQQLCCRSKKIDKREKTF